MGKRPRADRPEVFFCVLLVAEGQSDTGSATGWELGVSGDTARYGSGLGLSQNSWINGPSTPLVYWSPTALEITATGGSFAGGALRLVAHYAELWLPEAV